MIHLIGEEESKRTTYLTKAAQLENVPFEFIPWSVLEQPAGLRQLEGAVVKIDPLSFQTACFDVMNRQLQKYQERLKMLQTIECRFLNSPEGILSLLDKRETKRRLQQREISVTQMFPETVCCTEELLEVMTKRRCPSVFVKPVFFSGAAGVSALRVHPVSKKMCLYTSCRLEQSQLINTKKMFCLTETREIQDVLDVLLTMDCIVERWHPKAEFQGKSFDLRVVYQFGRVAYMVVRQSSGPVTNLHLNNQAVEAERLGLSLNQRLEIEKLCEQAVQAFDGISMAGIDIMLEKGSQKPRIIEMNGQGDLIYQDIFRENKIYREQVRWMKQKGERLSL